MEHHDLPGGGGMDVLRTQAVALGAEPAVLLFLPHLGGAIKPLNGASQSIMLTKGSGYQPHAAGPHCE